jgi:dTDP-4-amino-4,6-dideoxygalactose transaminase
VTQSSTAKSRQGQSSAGKFDPIPLLDLHRQYQQLREEVLAAVERVCSSQQFVLGAEVEALEREIAAFTGTRAAVGCASGTDALWLALLAAGVRAGDAVVTTAFSFFASASAIVRAGARPVLVDVDRETLNLDPDRVKARLRAGGSDKIRALLPVHLYGQCAEMDGLQRIADEFQLSIVEDAAQAMGAKWRGRSAGSLGVAAAFSFYPTKNLSAYGDAGLVTTADLNLAERMRNLRNHAARAATYTKSLAGTAAWTRFRPPFFGSSFLMLKPGTSNAGNVPQPTIACWPRLDWSRKRVTRRSRRCGLLRMHFMSSINT